MYYCNDCNAEIDDDDISYDIGIDADRCPECQSINVDYFKGAKNIEQQLQPVKLEQEPDSCVVTGDD